ncbi:MAG: 2-oxoacid:acceptor oxidoreductase subunit alpha [marine benthic group bacterium]|nr:2-oxoacid:acceptor oxidoreductase subunit alpha [Candidatus Benthicola marisminoris]
MTEQLAAVQKTREVRDSVVVRFAGDSGDGMQLAGTQFTMENALAGSDLATFPDYPAEIRAPAGTTYGVSSFQIHFGAVDVKTAGDELDVLVALNPAALKVNLRDLRIGGTVVVDTGSFTARNMGKADYELSPLEDDTLAPYQVIQLDIGQLTRNAVEHLELSSRDALRSRNMWALGLLLWMFDRDKTATVEWLRAKFKDNEGAAEAAVATLSAGHAFGETVEMPTKIPGYTVSRAELAAGVYRTVSGTDALAWGLASGLKSSGLGRMVFASYPITPASPLLHVLARMKELGVVTFQAEDEIAAACAAIGASYAGSLGVTSSSGPGIALKTEAIGLAVATELPLVVVNSQRGGPSTGLPTKTEQSDLFQAVYGRNSDTPVAVIAPATPADCFHVGREAVRLATRYMTPVFVLTDAYLANAAEPWLIPDLEALDDFTVDLREEPEGFQPYARDPETLARPWAVPGTPGLEHRIGGIERDAATGNISYDPDNHQEMTRLRAEKIAGIADDVPPQGVELGPAEGRLAVVGWGSTYGSLFKAVERSRARGLEVSHVHIRYLSPFPANLEDLLSRFEHVLVPEINTGQLVTMLRSTYLIPARGLNRVAGRPFRIGDVEVAIGRILSDGGDR